MVIVLDKKEANAMVEVLASALTQKPMHKQSNALKLAKQLDDEMPV